MSWPAMLPGLAALFGAIAAIFAGINGFSLVHEGEAGVLKKFGVVQTDKEGQPKVLKPGFRILIPWAWVVLKRNARLQTLSLSQQFVTNDGLVYGITAIINFKIQDIYKALIDVANLDEYLKSIGTVIVHQKVASVTEDDEHDGLVPNLEGVNSEIEEEIRTRQGELGVEIVDFKIVSFAPTPQAQQVLSISARARVALKSLAEFFGDKEKALKHPQVAAALIGTPVSTTVS